MDLVKAKKVLSKNFKDHNVKSDLDEETLLMFICVDLVREDMSEAPAPKRNNRGGENGNQQPT